MEQKQNYSPRKTRISVFFIGHPANSSELISAWRRVTVAESRATRKTKSWLGIRALEINSP
uniref:Uncharacterized protein n=1 Tax=Arundo donax TaxID=35708 RepID=A0A0A9DU99_ARUDO